MSKRSSSLVLIYQIASTCSSLPRSRTIYTLQWAVIRLDVTSSTRLPLPSSISTTCLNLFSRMIKKWLPWASVVLTMIDYDSVRNQCRRNTLRNSSSWPRSLASLCSCTVVTRTPTSLRFWSDITTSYPAAWLVIVLYCYNHSISLNILDRFTRLLVVKKKQSYSPTWVIILASMAALSRPKRTLRPCALFLPSFSWSRLIVRGVKWELVMLVKSINLFESLTNRSRL